VEKLDKNTGINLLRLMDRNYSRVNGLNIRECGRELCVAEKRVYHEPNPNRYWFTLHYIYNGKGEVLFRGKTYRVYAGDVFLVPPFEEIEYMADKDNPFCYIWAILFGEQAESLLQEMGMDYTKIVRHVGKEVDIFNMLGRMVEIYYLYGPDDFGVVGYFLAAVSAIIHLTENRLTIQSKRVGYIREVMMFVGYNFANSKLTINDIARDMSLTPSYLGSLFRKEMNIQLKSYISRVRIENAIKLIRETAYPVKRIAELTGYKDPLYFSKDFKKHTGSNPTQYRENISKKLKKKKPPLRSESI
jgi:AraC-like DNA-binding protein